MGTSKVNPEFAGMADASRPKSSGRPKDLWETNIWGGLPSLQELSAELNIPEAPSAANFVSRPNTFQAAAVAHNNTTTDSRLPNPCTDASFRAPVYEIVSWNVTRAHSDSSSLDSPVRIDVAATLWDRVNNYSMQCAGDLMFARPWDYWYISCAPEGGFRDEGLQQLASIALWSQPFSRDSGTNNLMVQQYWGCAIQEQEDIRFPYVHSCQQQAGDTEVLTQDAGRRVYTARATNHRFTVSCPSKNTTSINCNMTTPSRLQSDFTLPWNANQTTPLRSLPIVGPAEQRPQAGVPSLDCALNAFTHPDWTIEEGATYIPSPPGGKLADITLNLTITSRVTGIQHLCRWGGDHKAVDWYGNPQLSCALPAGAAFDASLTSYIMVFFPDKRTLRIDQRWVCGDSAGTYSKNYSSFAEFALPFFCTENGGRTCRTNKSYVRGQLQTPIQWTPDRIPAPPGAQRPGCTSDSQVPSWVLHAFRYEDERMTYTQGNNQSAPPLDQWRLGPRENRLSRTLTVQIRNKATDYLQMCVVQTFEGETDAEAATRWHRCYPDAGLAVHFVETQIQFDPITANLRVNETWFCADTGGPGMIRFDGTAATQVPYCGTITSVVNDHCYDIYEELVDCDWYYHTRWCATGTRNPPNAATVTLADTTLQGVLQRTALLPANAFSDPDPDPDRWSCTVDSLGRPLEWHLRETPDHLGITDFFDTQFRFFDEVQAPRSTLDFEFANSAFARREAGNGATRIMLWRTSGLSPFVPAWRPDFAYGLVRPESMVIVQSGGRRPFSNFVDWSLKYDAAKAYLELNHTWYCNDKTPSQP